MEAILGVYDMKLGKHSFVLYDLFIYPAIGVRKWKKMHQLPDLQEKRLCPSMIEAQVCNEIHDNYFPWMFDFVNACMIQKRKNKGETNNRNIERKSIIKTDYDVSEIEKYTVTRLCDDMFCSDIEVKGK